MKSIAVIQFPGSNCEHETALALKQAGLNAAVFRWNRPADALKEFDGFVLPGGFSYQDRVRAGAVAAKKNIMKTVFEESRKHKPVLGICNGAQILVESGILPGVTPGKVEMAIAPNRGRPGYYSDWVFLKLSAPPGRCVFTRLLAEGAVIPAPVAHAEGRFAAKDARLFEKLNQNNQVILRYSSYSGEILPGVPVNPNGSAQNIAGLANPEGTVLGLMPHPERAAFTRQVPDDLEGEYGERKREAYGDPAKLGAHGPGMKLFCSLAAFLGIT